MLFRSLVRTPLDMYDMQVKRSPPYGRLPVAGGGIPSLLSLSVSAMENGVAAGGKVLLVLCVIMQVALGSVLDSGYCLCVIYELKFNSVA